MKIDPARAEALFRAAAEIAQPQERSAFLDRECGDDLALRARVDALLAARGNPGAPLPPTKPSPAMEVEFARLKPEEAGERIGPYKLLQQIGEGGFGVVWMAEQEEPVRRRVALKILKMGMDTREVIARFEQERQALALMDHPNIAKVFDAGATPFGRPYFVMELVRGIKITDYCDQASLPTAERLGLFIAVCQAVQHAHQKGIIHRDLKPSNIMVTLHDGVPVPKVIDFGVAKATQGRLTDKTLFTQFEQMIGTPLYMAPEQAELSGLDIDTRSDIYALGVVLYELLTGRTPVDAETLRRASLDEMRRIIREQEPPRPSMALQTMAAGTLTTAAQRRGTEPPGLIAAISGDLDWIVMKAIEKDRTRRYETASAFALDLRRHLTSEPVAARPPSFGYRAGKFIRKHQAPVAAVAAVLAALAAGTVTSTVLYLREKSALVRVEEQKAEVEAKRAEVEVKKVEVEARKAEVERKNAEYRSMLAEAARSDRLAAEEKLTAGVERDAFAHLARACEYDPTSTLAAEKAAAALNKWRHPFPAKILAGHVGQVMSAQFSPDGTRIVTGSNIAQVWDAATGKTLANLAAHETGFSDAQFSPDGTRIVTASYDKPTRVWDAATGKTLTILAGHESGLRDAQFSPDGTRIVTASDDKTARVWDAATGKTLATLAGHESGVLSAQLSPDGTRIVTASWDKTARVWDAATGKTLATLAGHEGSVLSAQFSPDGTRIITASEDKTARVWDAATGKTLATLAGHEGTVGRAQFSPDGTRIVTASEDKTARVWDAATGKTLTILAGHEGSVRSAQYSPDGTRIVTASADKTARVWDAAPGKTLATLAGQWGSVVSAQFSPEGTRIVTASHHNTPRVCDAATGKTLATLAGHEGIVSSAQFSPDGTRIVTASYDKPARVWDAATGKTLATLAGHEGIVVRAQFSPDGTRIVTASPDKTARVWDAATGKTLATLAGHESGVLSAQLSPDGTRIVTAATHKTRVWDAATGKTLATLAGHEGSVLSAQFSPDGTRIVTASVDNTARVWDAATGKTLAILAGHEGHVGSAQFSPDGTRIVTASKDKTARVWDAATGKTLATLAGHEGSVLSAQFSPDGTRIVTASEDETARVWEVLPSSAGPPPEWFANFLRYMAQMRLNADGELETLKLDDWLALRDRMRTVRRASAGQDTPYLRILRRFVPE